MAISIARMNAMLTATAAGFDSTFNKAGRTVSTFAAGFRSSTALLSGAIAAVGFGTLVYGITSSVKAQAELIDTAGKLSDTLGITTESLTRLQFAAEYSGVSSDTLAKGLGRMAKLLGEATLGSASAQAAFGALGLSASELSKLPTEAALGKIADALNGVADKNQRAALAASIFGRDFASLMPLLREGSAGLQAAGDKSDRFGNTLSRIDAAQVEAANDAITDIEMVIAAVSRRLAVELSPYVQAAAEGFANMATAGSGIGPKVAASVEWVAMAVAGASDYVSLLEAGFYGFRAGALQAVSSVFEAVDWLGQGIVELLNLLPGVDIAFTDTFANLRDGFAQIAGEEAGAFNAAWERFQTGANATATGAFFKKLREDAEAAAKAVGESAGGAAADVSAITDEFEKIAKAQEDASRDAKRYWEQTRTPAEKYAAELEKINALEKSGALDADTAARARAKAQADLAGSTSNSTARGEQLPTDGPALLQAGSQAAASFVAMNWRREQGSNNPQERLVKAAGTTNQTLKAIETLIGKQTNDSLVVVNF